MIEEISIKNFKSVKDLKLSLGRVSVLIGENGSGKSNILEAIALLGAGSADKLDNEFLASRGIRLADASLMLSAFPGGDEKQETPKDNVVFAATSSSKERMDMTLSPRSDKWRRLPRFSISSTKEQEPAVDGKSQRVLPADGVQENLLKLIDTIDNIIKDTRVTPGSLKAENEVSDKVMINVRDRLEALLSKASFDLGQEIDEKELHCGQFLIYAPENTTLRRFEDEGQIQPIGIRGEGLFKMLQTFADDANAESLGELKKSLELVGWFFDFSISPNLAPGENRLKIRDRFLGPDVPFDQRSANEGFLFLIFYFAVFLSKATPQFFAIDNIDAALNPKLCGELMRRLCELAKKYDKQVILTTHNPAILDGLNLSDNDQRLYSVYRNDQGHTKVRRIQAPKVRPGMTPTKLSDAFMHGLIGGLPKNF